MISARPRISVCFITVILIAIPVFLMGIRAWWSYPRLRELRLASAIVFLLVAVLSLALFFLCRDGRAAAIFAVVFSVVWVVLLLPETQYYLDTRSAPAGSIVEPFYRQYEIVGYIMVLFPYSVGIARPLPTTQTNHLTNRSSQPL